MATSIKLFWQEDCVRCVPAKEICNILIERKVPVRLYDIGTIDGMTEAAFHEVISTPTTIIVDDDDNELGAWRGEAPSLDEIQETLENFALNILINHD
jgi:hypothetical protein